MKKVVAVILCALCLFGCGKRGRLDFPKGSTFPRQYPAAREPKQKEMLPFVEKEQNNEKEEINLSETGEQE